MCQFFFVSYQLYAVFNISIVFVFSGLEIFRRWPGIDRVAVEIGWGAYR